MARLSALVESYLFVDLDGTRTLSVSEDGVTYYDFTLSTTATVQDALSAWQTAINAHGSLSATYALSYDYANEQIVLTSSANSWIEWQGSLPAALGFASGALGPATSHASSATPKAIITAWGVDCEGWAPVGGEFTEVRRWGRVAVYVDPHGADTTATIMLPTETREAAQDGPLFAGGRIRLWPDATASGAYHPDTNAYGYLDGYVFRVMRSGVMGSADSISEVVLKLSQAESVANGAAAAAVNWATINDARRYGWAVLYLAEIEGTPFLYQEALAGSADPTGLEQDPSLVIDRSAAVGSRIDRKSGIGRGFDLTMVIRRNTNTQAIFRQPTLITKLITDLDWDDTTDMEVEDVTGWATSNFINLGREMIQCTNVNSGSDKFETLSRGGPNGRWKAYDAQASSTVSTHVTNTPLYWRGRQVKLWAAAVDPYGAVHGSDVLDDAAVVWRGKVDSSPKPHPDGWELKCTPLDAELTKPIGQQISGQGVFEPDVDPIVGVVDPQVAMRFVHRLDGTGDVSGTEVEITPLTSYTAGDKVRWSVIRAAWKAAFDTAVGAISYYSEWVWKLEQGTGQLLQWRPYIGINRPSSVGGSYDAALYDVICDKADGAAFGVVAPENIIGFDKKLVATGPEIPLDSSSDHKLFKIPAVFTSSATGSSIRVTSDTGDLADIPSSGWVRVKVGGVERTYRYTDVETDEANKASLVFAEGAGPNPAEVAELQNDGSSETQNFGVEFLPRASGAYRDVMRQILMSSGRGDNDGTYDTLASGSGLDLEAVAPDTWDSELDGVWDTMSGDLVVESRTSYADLFGALHRLDGSAVASRWSGGDVLLSVVRTSLYDTGDYDVSIVNGHLVRTPQGREPVRPVERWESPNLLNFTFRDPYSGDQPPLIIMDRMARDTETTRSEDHVVYGLRRDDVANTFAAWAQSMFSDRHSVLIYEIDVVPWLRNSDGEPVGLGDIVHLDLSHWSLWQKETGGQGYTGLARVMGRQDRLADGLTTLTVIVHGTYIAAALCPSAQVHSYDDPSAPTWIKVDLAYLQLFTRYLESSNPFQLVVYEPSADSLSNYVTVTDVQESSGKCELTIGSVVGTFTMTTAWHLTLPTEAAGNDRQDLHTHADDGTVFR